MGKCRSEFIPYLLRKPDSLHYLPQSEVKFGIILMLSLFLCHIPYIWHKCEKQSKLIKVICNQTTITVYK